MVKPFSVAHMGHQNVLQTEHNHGQSIRAAVAVKTVVLLKVRAASEFDST